ncbi:MAG: BamA/TamA family outer membrane protein, partial [Tannerella sp.]|nr:BamA/TamA family outer membrane protein [Tannerella sp.]
MKKTACLLCFAGWIACIMSCSTTRFVGDNEFLLDRVSIRVDSSRVRPGDLKPYLRQQPNFKIFGILKWPLYVYNWSGRNETKWLNRELRRLGEPPEIVNDTLTRQSLTEFERYLVNKGYLHAEVYASVDTVSRKKATVRYHAVPNEPYRIQHYRIRIDDPQIDSIVRLEASRSSWLPSLFHSTEEFTPLVQTGDLFDRDLLNKERQRITTLLRRRGYYAFSHDAIRFTADTVDGNRVNLEMTLKPLSAEDSATNRMRRPYYINRVRIVTGYDPLNPEKNVPQDSVQKEGIRIYYGKKGQTLRPGVLLHKCHITPGMIYSERTVEQTYHALMSLRTLRYVNIRYDEFEENDTLKLNCTILTTPEETQGVGIEVEGTNSAGDFGFASGLSYQHRNLFRGSELFSAKIRGAYEAISETRGAGRGNYREYSGETSVLFPMFVFPFVSPGFRQKLRATTELKLSYDHQQRPEYQREILSGGWSYIWQNRTSSLERHTLKLLDVNYIHLPYIDQSFKDSLPGLTTLYNYNDLFIFGSGYTYSFNNYDPLKRDRNTYSFRVSFESAGNLLYGLSGLFGAKRDGYGRYKLLGLHYSQFIKGDIDFARSIMIDGRNSLAVHLGGGIGYPYGNAKELPFERRYFAGGANSNRGWSVRSLGPGSMPVTDRTTFVNQVGDIRLDASIEYRSKLFWKFELAAYVDGGNIWTIRAYDYQPDGNFDFTRFYREIAVSYGLGVRLDFDYFLIRFDTGMKAYNPQEKGRLKWALLYPGRR